MQWKLESFLLLPLLLTECPPSSPMFNPNAQGLKVGRWLGYKGTALMNGISVLFIRDFIQAPESSLHNPLPPSAMWGHSEKTVYELGRKFSKNTRSASTFV